MIQQNIKLSKIVQLCTIRGRQIPSPPIFDVFLTIVCVAVEKYPADVTSSPGTLPETREGKIRNRRMECKERSRGEERRRRNVGTVVGSGLAD